MNGGKPKASGPMLKSITHLLPTPGAADSTGGGTDPERRRAAGRQVQLIDVAKGMDLVTGRTDVSWGKYEAAVRRWEEMTRPAPEPTVIGRTGTPVLNPKLSEWMMGLPEGWVTDHPRLPRSQALKILGNGVVPQQATAAISDLLEGWI